MRIDAPSPWTQAVARWRAALDRARRRLPPSLSGTGGALVVAVLVVLVALAYAATLTTTAPAGLVRSGERFAADDLLKVKHALDAKSIRYRVNEAHQVEVASERLDEANALVAKLDVGPRALADIARDALETPIWDALSNSDLRREHAANERLEALVRKVDEVVSAHVEINRPKARGLRAAAPASAFVVVETRDDRELSMHSIDYIQSLITSAEPDVKPEAISIFDHRRIYLNPKDPTLPHRTRTKTYRDELRQEIETRLEWLKDVQVTVQVTPPPMVPLAPTASDVPAAEPVAAPPPAPTPVMGVNQPQELAADQTVTQEPAPPVVATPPPHALTPTLTALPRVRVFVSIPRSYFIRAVRGRESSIEELQPLVERTRTIVETTVRHLVPPEELDEVTVNTFPDEIPAPQVSPLPATGRSRIDPALWVPIGVASGAALATALVGLGMFAARRPAPRSLGPQRTHAAHGRYKIDEASDPGPGPSERVRELIKLSPEAAASVLHRWTQGGPNG